MTRNLTATVCDDGGHEVSINFNIEINKDTPADRHPDDTSTMQETYYESPEIKSVELIVFGQGVDITEQYLNALKLKPNAKCKIENELCELAPDLLDD